MNKSTNKTNTTTTLTAKSIIATRKNLDIDLSRYWKTIFAENLVEKGYKRNYDLNAVLDKIYEESTNRAIYKVYQQCINMGIGKLSELNKAHNYFNIYLLTEKRELNVLLSKIPTLDAKVKRAKGKKNLEETEVLTSAKIKQLKKKLDLEISELLKKIEDFNNTAELIIDTPNFLAA